MPADVMILSAAIVAVFVIFGSVLYWGERRTRTLSPDVRRQGETPRFLTEANMAAPDTVRGIPSSRS